MVIWIFNHYTGTPRRQTTAACDVARHLVGKGHKVTIFASNFSNYSHKEEEQIPPGRVWVAEDYEGIRFIWVRTFGYRGNDWRRALNMLSYAWRAFKVARGLHPKPDVVIGSCPHTLAVLAAYFVARSNEARFFFEVRDLWPQTLIDVGALSELNPITWAFRRLEKFLYDAADRIITVLPNIYHYTSRLGIPEDKLVYVPNGVELTRFEGVREYDGAPSGTLTFMYLGGHHRYHGVGVIVEAAALLQSMGRNDVKIVIVGDGPEKPTLISRSRALGLCNLEFRPLVPRGEIGRVMTDASAFIHHIRAIPVLKYGMSSNKLADYMAAGRPIICAVSASNDPVKEADAGISIPPEDPEAMAQAILKLVAMSPEDRIRMGKNARGYAERNYDTRILAAKLESTYLTVLSEKGARRRRPF